MKHHNKDHVTLKKTRNDAENSVFLSNKCSLDEQNRQFLKHFKTFLAEKKMSELLSSQYNNKSEMRS